MISRGEATKPVRLSVTAGFPSASYFLLTFAISWIGAFLVAAPRLLRGESLSKSTGLMMFPVMLLGPSVASVLLTWKNAGADGVRTLFRRMRPSGFSAAWCATLLIPPLLVWCVLLLMQARVSPAFAPNHFWIGASFGLAAGFMEELGWTGYAFPTMASRRNRFGAAVILGVLWAIWHLPVIDYLGTATPHGAYWLRFFLAFALAMTAMRVLICWIYTNTGSLLLSQLMHVVSTGTLVVFSPPRVSAAQESLWYGVYGAALWIVVAGVVLVWGSEFTHKRLA